MFYVDLSNEEESKNMTKGDEALEKEKSKNGEKSGKKIYLLFESCWF